MGTRAEAVEVSPAAGPGYAAIRERGALRTSPYSPLPSDSHQPSPPLATRECWWGGTSVLPSPQASRRPWQKTRGAPCGPPHAPPYQEGCFSDRNTILSPFPLGAFPGSTWLATLRTAQTTATTASKWLPASTRRCAPLVCPGDTPLTPLLPRVGALFHDWLHNCCACLPTGRPYSVQVSESNTPFWGCPASGASAHLFRRSAPPCRPGLREKRVCEGLRGAQSTWKLFTAGSVGSQVPLPALPGALE